MKKIICLILVLLVSGCVETSNKTWEDFRITKDAPEQDQKSASELEASNRFWEGFQIAKDALEQDQIPVYLTDPNLTKLQRLHQWVQNGLAEGVFHSVDVEYNEVRMDPEPWSFLPTEQKQIFVTCLSRYFHLKGSTGRVTIRSKYSDEKLASYSVWTGIKIYK